MGINMRPYLYATRRPLVVYGAGFLGDASLDAFARFGIRADALCDSDPAKHGQWLHGLTVSASEAALAKFPGANVYIAVASPHVPEIRARLLRMGVAEERIFSEPINQTYSDFFRPAGYSVNPFGDLHRFGASLADNASLILFRLRYRHWVLGDRPENPEAEPDSVPEDLPFFPNATTMADALESDADFAADRGVGFEFDNGDFLAARNIFALRGLDSERRFLLRPGCELRRTRFLAMPGDAPHES